MDCTEPFSPCKGLVCSILCKWMLACEHGKLGYSQCCCFFVFFFPPLWFVFESARRDFAVAILWKLADKMGKVMFRDGTKAGRLPVQSPPPPC